MAKQQDNLSHHEQLRLDYLYKNFHYLNEREQEEYNYLKFLSLATEKRKSLFLTSWKTLYLFTQIE